MLKVKKDDIDKLNARCVELARNLKQTEDSLKVQEKINDENMQEIKQLKNTLKSINELITSNHYNNISVIIKKIKELTSDYQSIS